MDALDFDFLCAECGYNLRGLLSDRLICPECGAVNPEPIRLSEIVVSEADLRRRFNDAERRFVFLLGATGALLLLTIPAAIIAVLLVYERSDGDPSCCFCCGVGWVGWLMWSVSLGQEFASRAEPGGATRACVRTYWALFLVAYAFILTAFLGPLFWVTAPRHMLTPLSYVLRLLGLSAIVAALHFLARPLFRRVRERFFESQRAGLLEEMRDAAARVKNSGRDAL